MSIKHERREIRSQIQNIESATSKEELASLASNITRALFSCAEWREARCVFCYISAGMEVCTRDIVRGALEQGKILCVPRILDEPGAMEAALVPDIRALEDMPPDRYGIPSPQCTEVVPPRRIELVVAPGLAFGMDGRRMGHGGGYYDRYLSQKKFRAFRVGLCYPWQVLGDLPPAAPWDQPMDALALPGGIEYTQTRRLMARTKYRQEG